jgi:hypothetical protein
MHISSRGSFRELGVAIWPTAAEHLWNAIWPWLIAWSGDAAGAGGVGHVAVADGAGRRSGAGLEPLAAVSSAAASAFALRLNTSAGDVILPLELRSS